MQTDIAISPAGDVWAINNWQDIDICFPTESLEPTKKDLMNSKIIRND